MAARVIGLKAQNKTRAPWTIKGTETRTLIDSFYGGVTKANKHFLNIDNNVKEELMENYIRRDIEYIARLVKTINYRDLMLTTNYKVLSFMANNNFHRLLTAFYDAVHAIVGYEDHTAPAADGALVHNGSATVGRGANGALFTALKNGGVANLWGLGQPDINLLLTSDHNATNPLTTLTIGRYYTNAADGNGLTRAGYYINGQPVDDNNLAGAAGGIAPVNPNGTAPVELALGHNLWIAVTDAQAALVALNLHNYTGVQLRMLYNITTPANPANQAILTPQYEWIRERIYKLRIFTQNMVLLSNDILNGSQTKQQKYNATKVNRKFNNAPPPVARTTILFFKPITTAIRDIHQTANAYLNVQENAPIVVDPVITSLTADENIKNQISITYDIINNMMSQFRIFLEQIPHQDDQVIDGILYRLYTHYDTVYTLYMHGIPKQVIVTPVDANIVVNATANVKTITNEFATNKIQMKNKVNNKQSVLTTTLNAVNSLTESLNKAKNLVPHKVTNYATAQIGLMNALQRPIGQASIGTFTRTLGERLWYLRHQQSANVSGMFVKQP